MKKLVFIAFLFTGLMGQAQKQLKQQKLYPHSIEHYQHLKQNALTTAFVGAGLVATGTVLLTIGIVQEPLSDVGPFVMFLSGEVIILTGIPFMIVGSIKARNNGKAIRAKKMEMEKIKNDVSLSIGVTNNGVGLVLRF